MANQTPLAAWLYSNREVLTPKFKELNWSKRLGLDLFDFSTRVTINGIESEGRGVDENRNLALEKSVSEAIERHICKSLDIDSVGVAVMGNIDPKNHAKYEALERYFLQKHLKTKSTFERFRNFQSELVQRFLQSNHRTSVSFYRMKTPRDFFGIICLIQNDSKKSLGFALTESEQKSVKKAFCEALPNFAWMMKAELLEIQSKPWHVEEEFLNKIMPLLINNESEKRIDAFALPTLKEVEMKINTSILKTAPIKIARLLVEQSGITA